MAITTGNQFHQSFSGTMEVKAWIKTFEGNGRLHYNNEIILQPRGRSYSGTYLDIPSLHTVVLPDSGGAIQIFWQINCNLLLTHIGPNDYVRGNTNILHTYGVPRQTQRGVLQQLTEAPTSPANIFNQSYRNMSARITPAMQNRAVGNNTGEFSSQLHIQIDRSTSSSTGISVSITARDLAEVGASHSVNNASGESGSLIFNSLIRYRSA